MQQVILDTNFILTCVKQKIDFFNELEILGIRILIPKQVIEELEKISQSEKKLHFRIDAKLALRLLKKNRAEFRKINLEKKNVDKGILEYARENPEIIIASLDREIKNKSGNRKLVIRGKKKLEII